MHWYKFSRSFFLFIVCLLVLFCGLGTGTVPGYLELLAIYVCSLQILTAIMKHFFQFLLVVMLLLCYVMDYLCEVALLVASLLVRQLLFQVDAGGHRMELALVAHREHWWQVIW